MSGLMLSCLLLLLAPVGLAAALVDCDFEQDPTDAAWTLGMHGDRKPEGTWTDATSASGTHALTVSAGWWATPRIAMKPFQYYRVRLASVSDSKAYWWVCFFGKDGKPLASDHYSSLHASDDWRQREYCFRARHNAVAAEVRFQAISTPLFVDDVRVDAVSRADVATWQDRMLEAIPPVDVSRVPRPGPLLKRSMDCLRSGKPLRVVMLGDSIINDTGNSGWEALVERMYPGARIHTVISVRGGTGCTYYRQENRVKAYVLDLRPALLIIGGISNGYDVEAIRDVVRQVRVESDPDILVLSGAVSNHDDMLRHIARLSKAEQEAALERARNYRPGLARMAAEEKVEYFDIREHWDAYVAAIRKHPEWLRRDRPHCNSRGHQVLARLMAAYFSPAP
ncbi:SGNH/GDSL hydrolase family protein [bacterium]|nr:SGNH/GDSL hydrolase family protein [bacterium]